MTRTDADGLLAEQLLRLTRRLHRIQKRHLEPVGITPAQSRLLRTVAHFGEPPRMADLATRLEVVPRAVTILGGGWGGPGRAAAPRAAARAGGHAVVRAPRGGRPPAPGTHDFRIILE
ncbi:MarR family transcriptional regulator, partial [Streptomyces sp. NPDC058667]|uniref:MarR family transcriptional regulator n=1 Tax=Streptomyces sp. NPDC058667 TaxID=3346588 RepID=UPI003669639F